jgi:large subunit ribosomal protein L35
MPKLKTHKGAQKRFYVSGSGRLLRRKGLASHLRRKKSSTVRRSFDNKLPVASSNLKNLKRLLPYGPE